MPLLFVFGGPAVGLIGIEQAQAQSAQQRHREQIQGQVRSQRVRRMRVHRAEPKKSFLGGLFSSKPSGRQRAMRPSRGLKPLFNTLQVPAHLSGQVGIKAGRTPASMRASYARRMRAAAQRDAMLGNRRLRLGLDVGKNRARSRGGNSARKSRRKTSAGWGRGKYRTMCVRMCDGYYFPVSFKARSRNFKSEEQRCNASCTGSPTKLFFYANPGSSIKNMRALDGIRYKNITNAFRYRKEYVADCRCNVDPWSPQAKQRHENFALAQKQRLDQIKAIKQAAQGGTSPKGEVETAQVEQISDEQPLMKY